MKHQNMTFSIPEDLKFILLSHVRKRGVSQFISTAIRKALAEEAFEREQELDAAYEAANRDSNRSEILPDWNELDDVSDLIDEDEN
jgi:hypothetical protein